MTPEYELMTWDGEHRVVPVDMYMDLFGCSCGMFFSSDSGFAICPQDHERLAEAERNLKAFLTRAGVNQNG